MREDLLHYIWRYGKYPKHGLKTTKGESISVLDSGSYNQLSGPDFFNAQVRIGSQLWAGNVEIHINSSDWYAHLHQEDSNYDNVILHVVWNDDVSVFRADETEIPTLELSNYIDYSLLNSYKKLMDAKNKDFINCGNDIQEISQFDFDNWLERLYVERMEDKANVILNLLKAYNNDWEKVLFTMLLKNFGSKINGEAFFQIGHRVDFSIVRHLINKPMELESLLFGMAGLLQPDNTIDPYYKQLKSSFDFLCRKYEIDGDLPPNVSFFKLRPANFPTIRLSQFANLYSGTHNLFNRLMNCNDEDVYRLFKVRASGYWDSHYSFGKISKESPKIVSRKFIELLIINTLIPMRFCYQRHKGTVANESLYDLILNIKEERNHIVDNFRQLGISVKSAKDSQSLLQLYNNYCSKNKCLQCLVGTKLLNLKS